MYMCLGKNNVVVTTVEIWNPGVSGKDARALNIKEI